jgi:hypothetical protein
MLRRGLDIIPSFISQLEHDLMLKVCNRKLARLMPAYLGSHHDSVIKDYREALVTSLSPYSKSFDPSDQHFIDIVKRMADYTQNLVYSQRKEDKFTDIKPITWSAPHILDLEVF